MVCAGMTKGGSRFSSFLRYYWAVTIWKAQRGSCGALRLGVHREIKSRLGNHCFSKTPTFWSGFVLSE